MYPFEYPQVGALCTSLGYSSLLSPEEWDILRTMGLEYADDFTLISPLHLCMSSGFLPEKAIKLYVWAEEMINKVHTEQRELIEEIERVCWKLSK